MKKHLPDELAVALLELEQFVYHAAVSWESYWSLDSEIAHNRFRDVFRRHNWWYGGARDAYFMCAIISLAKFLETNRHTTNVRHFAESLSRLPDWHHEYQSISQMLAGCSSEIRDIALLRSNYYAHKNRNLTLKAMFKKTTMRYEEIPSLMQKMADILNVVGSAVGGSEVNPKAIAERTAKEMEALLLALAK